MEENKICGKTEAQVKTILKKLDYPQHIIDGGLTRLIKNWMLFVSDCQIKGYSYTFDEYINDLSTREVIYNVLNRNIELPKKTLLTITKYDDIFKSLLIEKEKFILPRGENECNKNMFWYYGIINNAKGDLKEDLIDRGGFDRYQSK